MTSVVNKTVVVEPVDGGSKRLNISKDSTTTLYDWASHGIVIQLSNHDVFTAFTITLNSSSIAEGIALRSESLELMSNWVDGSFELITIFGEQTRW